MSGLEIVELIRKQEAHRRSLQRNFDEDSFARRVDELMLLLDPDLVTLDRKGAAKSLSAKDFRFPTIVGIEEFSAWGAEPVIDLEASIDALERPLDLCVIGKSSDDPSVSFTCWRARSVPVSRLRGMRVLGGAVEMASLRIGKEGSPHRIGGWFLFQKSGGRWLLPRGSNEWLFLQEEHDLIQFMIGMQMALEYEWTVRMKISGSLGFSFASDPKHLKRLFKMREVPEGKTRRAALRNWICQHFRRRPLEDEEDAKDVFVHEHIRGATRYDWDGLSCEIVPSRYDLDKLHGIKVGAKQRKLSKSNYRKSKAGTARPTPAK